MHRIDGPGATADNRFTEGDPVGGVQATVVTDDWLNDVQEEMLSVLSAGGVPPVKGTQDQLLLALNRLLQTQKPTAFAASGTSTALTLTPSPAISSYAANQRFNVKFVVASGPNPTINVSAKGAKNIKQYDSSGAKISAVFVADQISDLVCDGTDFVLIDSLPPSTSNLVGIQGDAKNLRGSTTGLSAIASYTADELIVKSAAGAYKTLSAVSISPSLTVSGVDGLDTGLVEASKWYSVWVIWNGTTIAGLFSLSGTAPTMPAGYTHKALVDWVRTDATGSKFPLSQVLEGKSVQYKVAAGSNVPASIIIASGVQGNPSTPTWAAIDLSAVVPPGVARVDVSLSNLTPVSGQIIVAPNNQYGAYNSTTNRPPLMIAPNTSFGPITISKLLVVESGFIYYASNLSSPALSINGWEYR